MRDVCTCVYMHACRVHDCAMPYFDLAVYMFMPPTLKKLMGHIAFGASVSGCVGHTFCTLCNF